MPKKEKDSALARRRVKCDTCNRMMFNLVLIKVVISEFPCPTSFATSPIGESDEKMSSLSLPDPIVLIDRIAVGTSLRSRVVAYIACMYPTTTTADHVGRIGLCEGG